MNFSSRFRSGSDIHRFHTRGSLLENLGVSEPSPQYTGKIHTSLRCPSHMKYNCEVYFFEINVLFFMIENTIFHRLPL